MMFPFCCIQTATGPGKIKPGSIRRCFPRPAGLYCGMALVRIIIHGYSLLHNWPELAPGKPRHSAAARKI
jgi:hypothetical protein